MKTLLFLLLIILFTFGLSSAVVDFRVEFDGFWVSPDLLAPMFPVHIKIYMNNNDITIQGYAFTISFDGDLDIIWWENGSFGPNNTLDLNPDFVAGGPYFWEPMTFLNFYFDGVLPDEFNHTAGGFPGWPASPDEVLVYDFAFVSEQTSFFHNPVLFCVDSINEHIPSYDWLFGTGAVFNLYPTHWVGSS